MESALNDVDVRVLGSLIEKEITTPDNYPLTLNSLVAACNQTSNREPVLALDEDTVSRSIEDLRKRSLVRAVQRSDSRAMRYRQLMSESMSLDAPATAALSVLMLRGPQTAGEIKTRSGRLFDFADLMRVETTLESLMARQPEPLVVRLPRRPGQKEARYAHLLSGEPAELPEHAESPAAPQPTRVEELEQKLEAVRAEVADLRAQFEEFRRSFG
jgi:uncharacterized protein YceH (UPF0502 family)